MTTATRTDVEAVVEILKGAKQAWRPRSNTVEVWHALLNDVDAGALLRAAARLGKEHRGNPDVEVLRRYVTEDAEREVAKHRRTREVVLAVLGRLENHVSAGGTMTAELDSVEGREHVLAWVAGVRGHVDGVQPGEALNLAEEDLEALRAWQAFFVKRDSGRAPVRPEQAQLFGAAGRRAS